MKNNENKGRVNRTIVVICGVLLGVVLMAFGVYRNINSEYSKLNLPTAEKIQAEINEAYQRLETDRKALLDEFDIMQLTVEFRREKPKGRILRRGCFESIIMNMMG